MLTRTFQAMGSPCEVQMDCTDQAEADRIGTIVRDEALRIEHRYSRYRDDSVISQINASAGAPLVVDQELAALLDYAAACYRMSGGRFDITSGILRRAWIFDGSSRVPAQAEVDRLLPLVGWNKVGWVKPQLRLQLGMELDLGGLGKEFAVDRAIGLVAAESAVPCLINFGGDLRVTGPRRDGTRWRVLIEGVDDVAGAPAWLEIDAGAITTSGDARRFVVRNGQRFGHILDPRSGRPVKGAPRAVTVAAPTCLEAGILSTVAMLHGRRAETFLRTSQVQAWITR